ncbi:hypothetical protein BGZ94_003180 [Podila epigama]|nr:hypothetical protein BGZ94_003180 [Podila epigama]
MTVKLDYPSFIADDASTEQQAQILNGPATFEVSYFNFTCIGATPRYLLEYGGVEWTDNQLDVNNFEDEQAATLPFGVLPILKVKPLNGEGEATIAESWVIDTYLAKRFNLLGKNEYEEQTIKAFYSHIHYLRERSLMKMSWTFPDKRKQAFETFTEKQLPWWISVTETHLKKNHGGNGHFFGESLTLADIHLLSALDHFSELPRGEEIIAKFNASPLLWKVKETAQADPRIAAWRNSEAFRALQEGGQSFYTCTAAPAEPVESSA